MERREGALLVVLTVERMDVQGKQRSREALCGSLSTRLRFGFMNLVKPVIMVYIFNSKIQCLNDGKFRFR